MRILNFKLLSLDLDHFEGFENVAFADVVEAVGLDLDLLTLCAVKSVLVGAYVESDDHRVGCGCKHYVVFGYSTTTVK